MIRRVHAEPYDALITFLCDALIKGPLPAFVEINPGPDHSTHRITLCHGNASRTFLIPAAAVARVKAFLV